MKFILAIQLFSTLFMVGLIWFVQVVHYPLFANVGREHFTQYEQLHQRLTTWVVAPVMLLELGTAFALFNTTALGMSSIEASIGIGLLAVIWTSTWLLQVPAHELLTAGFAQNAHVWLVATNRILTFAGTARGVLLVLITLRSIPS